MVDYDQHVILQHLDDPLRIFKWTVDEAAIIIAPIFFGLGVEEPTLGLLSAGVGFVGLKHLKKKVGLGTLRHALYWYLPKNQKLSNTPPSYIREYMG
ncbi:MAG: type IV conjugative transfer system protein TraL [Alphaproteobacteria bacterium]|jgi:type IV conjugative transfer system protein TraL|nr:type IV conjugative transfer system protein TraL [Alphaproteobacteria bacterium]MBT5389495.1 type IV conjugative transfer system protein TraL [Alphaproteobacteria bacterium]MBT5540486.1 type IV conjugative transfer system protein TraL [Alphaproteobacteria bacterium]MBT5654498.1 type IV conjugative transfer system protein TraL [Alphaproteobacteria bacterium]